MARIIGVALNSAKKFLGFVDEKGKIRKGRVRRLHNPAGKKYYGLAVLGAGISATFKTRAAANKYRSGLYSRGLLFGRTVQIIEYKEGTNESKVVFEKSY